jgi:hypothetical protein
VMQFPGFFAFFIDGADFTAEHEPDHAGRVKREFFFAGGRQLFFELEQAGFRRFQIPLDFGKPFRMGDIPGTHHGDSLEAGGDVEICKIQIFGRSPGKAGMNVKISDKFHGPIHIRLNRFYTAKFCLIAVVLDG